VFEAEQGGQYFLKLYGDSARPTFVASSLEFYLPLAHQLHTRGILPNIAHPVPTVDGRFFVPWGRNTLILFDFIEGPVVGHGRVIGEVLAKLAHMVGRLHRSGVQIQLARPLIESFDIVFEAELTKALQGLPGIPSDDRWGRVGLRDLLLPQRARLFRYLDRLRELQARVRAKGRPTVVCHTDLHGENLMRDSEGNLYILDWENAMIAPPEHDLFFFAGYDSFWDVFLPRYERETGPIHLDHDTLGFYYYRRGLEDLSCWLVRILEGSGSEEQDRSDLAEIAECVEGLYLVEGMLAGIKEKERQHRGAR
jgi:hypothetical protein